jgi:lipid-binding SYLF domain-containing protein
MLAAFAVVKADQQKEATERVRAASEVLQEIMAAPDKGIPDWVLERAHCAVIVPGMKQGGFVVGARYGKGVALCRDGRGGWTGPSTVRTEGGSFGLQIGGGEVDVVLFVMNEKGKDKLLKSRFTLGGELAAMAGPVGRAAKAETDALMHAKILSYSRSRGVFAGAVIQGATLRPDDDDNKAIYAKDVTHEQILGGGVAPPESARSLITMLGRYSWREQKGE